MSRALCTAPLVALVVSCAAPATNTTVRTSHRVPATPTAATPSGASVSPAPALASSAPPPSSSAPEASSRPPPPPLPACNGDGIALGVDPVVELACDDRWHCDAAPAITVRNCGTQTIDASVHVRERDPSPDASGVLVELRFEPIPPGEHRSRPLFFHRVATFEVTAHFVAGDTHDAAIMQTIRLTNGALEHARAACRECNGDWGPRGMMQTLGCLCRTRDAGTHCEDGNDCEGDCLATGHRVVRRGFERRNRNGTVTVGMTLAVPVGRCSEFRTTFGCHAYVPDGARVSGPQPVFQMPRGIRCTD